MLNLEDCLSMTKIVPFGYCIQQMFMSFKDQSQRSSLTGKNMLCVMGFTYFGDREPYWLSITVSNKSVDGKAVLRLKDG